MLQATQPGVDQLPGGPDICQSRLPNVAIVRRTWQFFLAFAASFAGFEKAGKVRKPVRRATFFQGLFAIPASQNASGVRTLFALSVEPTRRLISITLPSNIDPAIAREIGAAKARAADQLGDIERGHVTLFDVRALRVQPQSIMQMFADFVRDTPRKSLKVAILVGEGTSRMQFRRLAEAEAIREDLKLFTERTSAVDWLLA
ncbi:MAG: hypothetical protein OSA47_00160 [Novosphingopyxis baekryungensis]|jgi:hypothetical protein|nr:hypothetical protein [Novosphingopyxis baekryungensis]